MSLPKAVEAQHASTRVLLVEDYQPDVVAIRALLESFTEARFVVAHADSLSIAQQHLNNGGLDLVLLDLRLPDAQGFESLEALRSRFPSVPIIVLTAMTDRQHATDALSRGAMDYIVKGTVDGRLLGRSIMRHAREAQQ